MGEKDTHNASVVGKMLGGVLDKKSYYLKWGLGFQLKYFTYKCNLKQGITTITTIILLIIMAGLVIMCFLLYRIAVR